MDRQSDTVPGAMPELIAVSRCLDDLTRQRVGLDAAQPRL